MALGDDVDLEEILQKTEGFTGADIRCLCNLAGQCAIANNLNADSISQNDFISALQNMKASISEELLQKYKSWNS